MAVTLAVTHHDPDGRCHAQALRVLPLLNSLFAGIAVHATHATSRTTLDVLAAQGALVQQEAADAFAGYTLLGRPRRAAVALGLHHPAEHLLFCDFDRVLHWAETYPEELAEVVTALPQADCTVLGRTARAYDTHPQVQRDTEALINHVFWLASGLAWDIGAGARGLSRRAAEELLANCPDESIGNDGTWPIHLLRQGDCAVGYAATEGLEFETPDRYRDQIDAAGGLDVWLAQIDTDPRQWAQRLAIAHAEAAAIAAY